MKQKYFFKSRSENPGLMDYTYTTVPEFNYGSFRYVFLHFWIRNKRK